MRGALAIVLVVLAFAPPSDASAHPLAPSVLSFEQMADGKVLMRWRAPATRPIGQSLRPRVPESCEALGPPERYKTEDETAVVETIELRCDPPNMVGAVLAVDGFADSSVNVVVRVVRANGDVHHAILDTHAPSFTVAAPEDESHSFFEYLSLGIGHLLTGWDHLTFVLGLLVLFGWHRRLIAAVTAFTIGHSLTLGLAVLGIVSVPTTLVEALIAVTIIILALEIQSEGRGPVWRHPWTLPGALGLLHGLGFASVLFDAGLPPDEIPLALLGFNLGLEVGQLSVIAVAALAFAVIRRALPLRWQTNRAIPAYLIGSLAAFWLIERTLA
jgi:hydrogenase/urease accessory protein HupE